MTTNFCSEYVSLSNNTEIPPIFTAWCGLSAVSCALGRRVWIDMGPFKIYPNMYVILVAGSGRMRKSTAINVARDMLEMIDPPPNMIGQKVTPEALLHALKTAGTAVPVSGGGHTINTIPVGQGFIITDELTTLVNKNSAETVMMQILIEMYDCRNLFITQTMMRGKEVIRDTQLGMLAATTPEELRKAIPEEAFGSGFASRVLFVYEDRPSPPVPFPVYTPAQLQAREYCVRALQRFFSLSGPIALPPDSITWCEEFYRERYAKSPFFEDAYLKGYASRRFVHVLKLAINLAVGLTESTSITPSILSRAEKLLNTNEERLSQITRLITMNDKGAVADYVLGIIRRHKKVTRTVLLRHMMGKIDANELVAIIDTLAKSGQVSTQVVGTNIFYVSLEDS